MTAVKPNPALASQLWHSGHITQRKRLRFVRLKGELCHS